MIETITYNNQTTLKLQSLGNSQQFALPYAKHLCKIDESKGEYGFDVGYNRDNWRIPWLIGVDITKNDGYHAFNLPLKETSPSVIASMHLIEHLDEPYKALSYWTDCLAVGGNIFIYVPSIKSSYWKPWHNTKHKSVMIPEVLEEFLKDKGYKNIFVSGIDLNYSFMCCGEKS